MQCYLLSVKDLTEELTEFHKNFPNGALYRQSLAKLDECRRQKIERLRAPGAVSQSIGAGLLLQLAWQRRFQVDERVLGVSQLLSMLGDTEEIPYVVKENGKPDFDQEKLSAPFHFNLSHSGEYVCLVTADREIGVDIQQLRPLKNYRIAERFFRSEELDVLYSCSNDREKEVCFYQLWTRKEAYAKLTGEGIPQAISANVLQNDRSVRFTPITVPEGYLAECCYFE